MKPDRKKKGKAASRKSAVPSGNGPDVPSKPRRGPVGDTEPTAGYAHAPIWLIILFGGLFYWAQLYLDEQGGGFSPIVYEPYHSINEVAAMNPKSDTEMMIAKGRATYDMLCATCHQPTGLGGAQAPPLAGSEWVLEPSPNRLIRIPILGLTGPIQVKGQQYNMNMVALGSAFQTDEDLAAVLTYIRQAWGNNAPPVTPEQVAAVKAEIGNRAQQLTADELMRVDVSAQ